MRRLALRVAAITLTVLWAIAPSAVLAPRASAETYPSRQLTMIVPFAAGGSSDAIARIVAERLGQELGQTVVIENDGGAGGTTATARAARATPDGYLLIMGNMGTHGAGPSQYANLKYDPRKDFAPIGLSAGVPAVIVTRRDFPAADLKTFITFLKEHPDKVNEAHAGVGSQTHAMCSLLLSILDAKPARIAYRSTGQALNDMVAGQVDFGCSALTSSSALIEAGSVKALAIASPARAPVIPDVPTTIEAGLPAFQVSAWNALFAPQGLSPEVHEKLASAHAATLDDPRTRERLLKIGAEIPGPEQRTPAALQALVEKEVARWKEVLKP